jgi:hypothetical protein
MFRLKYQLFHLIPLLENKKSPESGDLGGRKKKTDYNNITLGLTSVVRIIIVTIS